MKLFGIVFLLLNVVLLSWQYNLRVEEATRELIERPPMPAGIPKLVLLSELDVLPQLKVPGTEPAPAVTSESQVKADVEAADLCIEVGPFSNESARHGFTDWVGEFVAALHFRVETIRKRQLFWIYLEPKSDVEAEQRMADLRRRGVQDYMMIRRGGLKNAISLGLFSSQDSVNRRLAELNEQGYQAVVVPRYETTDRYWGTAQLAADSETLPEIPDELLGAAELAEIECVELVQVSAVSDSGIAADDPTATN